MFKTRKKRPIFFINWNQVAGASTCFSYYLFGNELLAVNVRAHYNIFLEQKKHPRPSHFVPSSTL